MICSFNDVIDVHGRIGDTEGVCFKYVPRLIVSQAAAFYMIRVICQVYLDLMINAA